ncbi:MAG: hypothetical protein R2883_03035 [Caldisericia bacterium]
MLSNLTPGKRYKITYGKNWLGKKVIMDVEQLPDPCDISIFPETERVLRIGLNTEEIVSFSVRNNLDTPIRLPIFVEMESSEFFNGEVIKQAEEIELEARENRNVQILVKTRSIVNGTHRIIYGVECGEEKIIRTVRIEIDDDIEPEPEPEPEPTINKAEITVERKFYCPINFSKIDIEIKAANYSNEDITILFENYDTKKYKVCFSEEKVELENNEEKIIIATVVFVENQKKYEGFSAPIEIIFENNGDSETEYTIIIFTAAIVPDIDMTAELNSNEDEITIDADINWRGGEKGKINILIYTGVILKAKLEDVTLPYKFKIKDDDHDEYGKLFGQYAIFIEAYIKDTSDTPGKGFTSLCLSNKKIGVNLGSIYNINVIRSKSVDGQVNINCYYKKADPPYSDTPKLKILWGDGQEDIYTDLPTGFQEMLTTTHIYSNHEKGTTYTAYLILFAENKPLPMLFDSCKVKVRFPK